MVSTKRKTCTTHGKQRVLHILGRGGDILAGKCLAPAIKWGGNVRGTARSTAANRNKTRVSFSFVKTNYVTLQRL